LELINIQSIIKILTDKSQNIVIVSHVNPDGDAVGSSLGFYHFLTNDHYENVTMILPGSFPSFLAWMPAADRFIIADQNENQAISAIGNADIIFCLDFNDLERTARLSKAFKKSKGIFVLIDHHPNPKDQFDFVFSNTKASSTSELIYEFIVALGKQHLVNLPIAECLYAGIVTDTGSFSYACNHTRTYYIIGHFMDLGLDGEKIHRQIYDNYSENRIRLLGYCLSTNLRILAQQQTAYIFLSNQDLINFQYQEGDSEGVVNYGLSVKGIRLAAIFIERKDQVKISFRSEGDLNVDILARKYFNGGGHKNASGGSSNDSLVNTIAKFEEIVLEISKDDFSVLKVVQDND
jgi:bifunctional oligoribonuclease and PAP phosphatase NrnA